MGGRRRIVPDNSVMFAAYFEEAPRQTASGPDFDLSRRARHVLETILACDLEAFAPEMLLHEFTKNVVDLAWPRDKAPSLDADFARAQVGHFLSVPIRYQPGRELAEFAWSYMVDHHLAPPDSWYLACAVRCDAELWLSHPHADRFVEMARRVYDKVYTLAETRFDQVT